jgi:hypothetical protein
MVLLLKYKEYTFSSLEEEEEEKERERASEKRGVSASTDSGSQYHLLLRDRDTNTFAQDSNSTGGYNVLGRMSHQLKLKLKINSVV